MTDTSDIDTRLWLGLVLHSSTTAHLDWAHIGGCGSPRRQDPRPSVWAWISPLYIVDGVWRVVEFFLMMAIVFDMNLSRANLSQFGALCLAMMMAGQTIESLVGGTVSHNTMVRVQCLQIVVLAAVVLRFGLSTLAHTVDVAVGLLFLIIALTSLCNAMFGLWVIKMCAPTVADDVAPTSRPHAE